MEGVRYQKATKINEINVSGTFFTPTSALCLHLKLYIDPLTEDKSGNSFCYSLVRYRVLNGNLRYKEKHFQLYYCQ